MACLATGVERAAAQTAPAPAAPPARRASVKPSWLTGGYVDLNAGIQGPAAAFTATVDSTLYVEPLAFASRYRAKVGAFVGGRAGIRIGRSFVVGIGLSYLNRSTSASTDAQLPHPFYFDQTRPIAGTSGGLTRVDVGAHLELGWLIRPWPRSELMLFVGPSALKVRVDLVTHLRFVDAYPYDTVRYTGVESAPASKTAFGFHLGGDLTHMLSKRVGLGVLARYSRARLALEAIDGQSTTSRSSVVGGGFQFGAGLRFRF